MDVTPTGSPTWRTTVEIKPRLRGWSHLVATVPAAVMTMVLILLAHGHVGRQFALLGYGLSSVVLFLTSGIYHTGNWSPQRKAMLRRLDHANIFLLIGGTYTPVVLTLLSGAWMISVIATVWAIGVLGIILVVPSMRLPRPLIAAVYVAMGWVAIVTLPVLTSVVGPGGLTLMLVGGGLYTLGAVAYALRWPTPIPGWFGYHEVFHAFTIAANSLFFTFMVAEVVSRP